jgi:PhoD related phosphatase
LLLQIVSMPTYWEMFMRMAQLPSSVQQLVLVATVPVVYPHLTTSQKVGDCSLQ